MKWDSEEPFQIRSQRSKKERKTLCGRVETKGKRAMRDGEMSPESIHHNWVTWLGLYSRWAI